MKFFAISAAFLLICALASVQATPGGQQPQAPSSHHGSSGGHGASAGHGSGHNVPVSHGHAGGYGAPVSHGHGHH